MTTPRSGSLAAGKLSPLDLATIAESLKDWGVIVHLFMRIERVFAYPQLIALANHHIDRIMQDSLNDEVAQVRHKHPSMWEILKGHR